MKTLNQPHPFIVFLPTLKPQNQTTQDFAYQPHPFIVFFPFLKPQNQTTQDFASQQPPMHLSNEELWEAPFSHGLHSCVNPTSKYQAFLGGDHFITVRSNGGFNQMRTGGRKTSTYALIVFAILITFMTTLMKAYTHLMFSTDSNFRVYLIIN